MNEREESPAAGLNAALSRVLRGEARAAGLSYEEIATRSGVSKSTVTRMLKPSPTRHLDVNTTQAIAAAVGADLTEVWQRAERLANLTPAAAEHLERQAEKDRAAKPAQKKSGKPIRKSAG